MSKKDYVIVGGAHDGNVVSVISPPVRVLRMPNPQQSPSVKAYNKMYPTEKVCSESTYILRNLTFNLAYPAHHPNAPKFKTVVDIDYYLSAEISEVDGVNTLLSQALKQYESNK